MTYSSFPSVAPAVALSPLRAVSKRRRAQFPTRLPSNVDARAELAAVQRPPKTLSPALPSFQNIARMAGQPPEELCLSVSLPHIPLFHAFKPPIQASRCAQSPLGCSRQHLASPVRKYNASAYLSTKTNSIRCRLRICKPKHQSPQTSNRNISFYTHLEEGLRLDKYMFRFLNTAPRDVKTCETRHPNNNNKHRSKSPSPRTVIVQPTSIQRRSSDLRRPTTSTSPSRLGNPTVAACGSYSVYSVYSDSDFDSKP